MTCFVKSNDQLRRQTESPVVKRFLQNFAVAIFINFVKPAQILLWVVRVTTPMFSSWNRCHICAYVRSVAKIATFDLS